jgi:hypothetical protein
MSNSVPDILKQLDDLNKQSGIAIYVPSLQRTIKFKALNLLQQKELLKSSIDETLTKLSFITSFYNIIQDNILEPININTLFIFDRTAIALALRAASLDSKYTLEDNVYDLNDLVANISNITTEDTKSIIDLQNLSIELEIPRLDVDREISNAVLNKFRAAKTEDIKTVVSELFIHEILKYIKSVTFKTDTESNTVTFKAVNLDSKLAIAEKFPTTITNQILDFIKKFRDFENQYTKIGDTNIEVDGSFFAI